MKTYRKTWAFILCFVLILSLCSALPAQSEKASVAWDGSVDISWYDPTKSEYYIRTPAQLAGLAALVNGMVDPTCPQVIGDKSYIKSIPLPNTMLVGAGGGNISDTVYTSEIDFAYKTVYLTADLDMGGVYRNGSWSGPNWTPIGGKFPMKPSVVDGDCYVLETRFNGVLDGQGHTVRNIYCNRYAEKGFPYSMAVGLVGFLGGNVDTSSAAGGIGTFKDGWQPAVKNVVVGPGYIYARRMVGGVVGRVGETSNGIVIENCANFADIYNTDSKGIGGIVGAGWGKGVVRNCYNVGSVTTTYVCPAGGICGNNQGLNIYNCYNVGTIDSNNQKRGRGIGGHDTGSYTVANCYYLQGCDDDPESGGWYKGTSTKISIDVKSLTSPEMKTPEFIKKLNASGTVFAEDSANINNGYPVFYFQAQGYSGKGSFDVTMQQPSSGGKISADFTGAVSSGQTVTLSAQAQAGWTLKYFTLNGEALSSNFFTVSADSAVSAVFAEVKQVAVTLPQSDDSYLSFTKTGYEMSGGDMVYVVNKAMNNGDALLAENILKVTPLPWEDVTPKDPNLEYTGSYGISVTNAEKNADGSFTVTGVGNVAFTVTQNTSKKSWLSMADSRWYTGESDTYTLTTAAQLAGMAYLVNVEGVDFKGTTISLGNDISLANMDGTVGERVWEACGSNMSRPFSGVFDGRGYSIYDMTAYNNGSYAGLFGCCVGATIKNVTVRGTVTGEAVTAYAAGIVSYASGSTIENCVNRAVINASGTGAAGIAAYISDDTIVMDCVNRGDISGTSGVGGIVGICYSTGDVIENCFNYGEINASGDSNYGSGGIAGRLAGTMTGCGSFAAIASADRYTGGLVGYATARNSSEIINSVSTGDLSSACANQTAAVGSAVGYAQYLTFGNVKATGSVSTGASFKSSNKGGLIGLEGTVTDKGITDAALLPASKADADTWTKPAAKKAPWTVTFMADGKVVDTVTYSSAAQAISEPPVPSKEGYMAGWDNYTLGSQDLTVPAVYRQIIAQGGDLITQSGVYFLDPVSHGELTIADGLTVTLNGYFGACEGLSVTAGEETALVLENVTLSGSKTLLTLSGGTLTLKGKNKLVGICDVKDNLNPTISVSGSETIAGTGSLYVSAVVGNAAVKLAPEAVLELKSGTLSLQKEGLLGSAGGALYAGQATVIISGGTFLGYTNSDNVSVISARNLQVSGGRVRAQASKSPVALQGGTVSLTGGTLYCMGHSGNSQSLAKAYYNTEAITGLSGAAKCAFEKALPLADVYVTDEYFDAVRNVYSAGYLTGTSANQYSPDMSMTRGMFVTVLYRMAGSPAVSAPAAFNDLKQGWYKNAVAWAVKEGITEGTSETSFSPNANVTLQQAAVFLRRYAEMNGKTVTVQNGESGAGAASWARASVAWAAENGMLPLGSDFTVEAKRSLLAMAVTAFDKI